jgi:hypothetical protein
MITKSSAAQSEVSNYDFRTTFWGMTRNGVRHSESSMPESESPSHLAYKDRVLELHTIVGYHFIDNSLVEAGYAFREHYDCERLYVEQYGKLKDHLSVIYGNPILDEDINTFFSNSGEEDIQELESLMLLTEWLTDRSIIRMILMGDTDRCEFGVLHRSRGHIHVLEDTERSVRWGIN